MKKFSISFFIMLLLFSFPAFAQDFWELVPTPDTANPWSLCFNTNGDIWVGSNGVYLSQDQGQSWEYKGLIGITVSSLIFDSMNNVFVGNHSCIFKSQDYGYTWNLVYNQGAGYPLSAGPEGLMLTGGGINIGYLLRSTDYGENWDTSFVFPGTYERITDIVRGPDGSYYFSTTAWMGGGGGVYCSEDNGLSLNHIGLLYSYVEALSFSPEGKLYAAVYGHHYTGIGGCYVYDEENIEWIFLTPILQASGIAINSIGEIYLGISNEVGGPGGIYRSQNCGQNWHWLNSGLIVNSIVDVWLSPDEYVYALTYSSHKLHRSINPTVSTKEEKINDFCVDFYPNPFVNDIYINFPCKMLSTNNELFIYDIKGELIKKINIFNNQNSQIVKLNTANWPIGIYFYRIHSNDNVQSGKIIKSN